MNGLALVGRDREIEALDGALTAALGGRLSVLMLSGEPGIGKTRLLEELARRVVAAGGVAAWGRTWEVGLTPSFWPWIQLLDGLETANDRSPALGDLETHTDAGARLAWFGQVRAFLQRRAEAAPIALLLDDLHAADPSSLQLLEYLFKALVGRRVLFALAARDSDASPETASALGRIQRGALRLPLARLNAPEVRALVGDRADAGRVFELSEGNPLFVEELVASQQSRGKLSLPALSSVREVIRGRVARLPEPTRSALCAAALLGRDFRGSVLAEMLGTEDALPVLEPALEVGMIAMTSPDRFRFSHALVAEALSEELTSSERAHLHLHAARAVERHEAGDTSAIAHHLLAAGHLAAEAAVGAAERAAEQCRARLAFEDAAALLDRALEALALVAPRDDRRRAGLLCARAEALQHAAQHPRATALCDEAAAIARQLDDGELFARIALTRGLEFRFGRTDPLLVAILSEALDRLGDVPALRAKLLARLAAAEQPARDPQEPVARALEAIELARALDARDRLEVTYVATSALVDYVHGESIERIHHEVLALARGRDRWITVHTRLRLCFAVLQRIDRFSFDKAVEAFSAEAAALGLPQWTRYTHMLAALTATLQGRFADAEREVVQAEALSEALGDTGARFMIDVHRAMSASVRTAPIDPRTRATIDSYIPGRGPIRAWIAVQEGDCEAARSAMREFGTRLPLDPDLRAMLAGAIAFAGESDQAAQAYLALESNRGGIVMASLVGATILDLYDRLLLVLAARIERWDVIDGHAARALEIAEKLGSPVWVARTRADWADALERRGRAGDAEHAAELRAQALEAAERLEMPGLATRCRAANTPAHAKPREESPRPMRVELVRQGELWIVSGFGEKVHVKDSRGLQMIARLIEEPGSAHHVLELSGATAAVDGGDAGPALDARARSEYRTRLAELVAERDEAEGFGDRGRLERANAEIEALTAELERAFGLGGRERKVGAASERARSNVQRRIAHALGQIRAASPRLGEHLTAAIRTGTYCSYEPST